VKRRVETEEPPTNPKRQRTGTGPHHPQVEDMIRQDRTLLILKEILEFQD